MKKLHTNLPKVPCWRYRKHLQPILLAVLLLLSPILAYGQVATVTGTITDDTGDPLPGVNIVLKGTSSGTLTDINGNYSLDVPDENAVLIFSYIGFTTAEVIVGTQSVIDFALVPDVTALDEIVVIGYGTTKKTDLTGAVGTLSGESIYQRQTIKAAEALQGTMPGVTVTRTDGRPGADPVIRIRGTTSIGNSNPLVLIDGVPSSLNNINPKDIESISVLKDGASASIYGSRAAAGVILVTTKRARSGELEVDYTYEYVSRKPTRLPNNVGAQDYMQFINERNWNDAGNMGSEFPTYDEALIANYPSSHAQDPDSYPNTDYSTFFSDYVPSQRHLISFKGGTESVSSLVSMSYNKNDGFSDNHSYETFTIRNNNDITFNKILSAHLDFNYQNSYEKRENGYPMLNLMRRSPLGLAFWSDGRAANTAFRSDMAKHRLGGTNKTSIDEIRGRFKLDLKPVKGLVISGMVSPSFNFVRGKTHAKAVPIYDLGNPSSVGFASAAATTKVTETRNNSNTMLTQFLANYSYTLAEDHSFSLLGGYENYSVFAEGLTASRDGYVLSNFPYLNLGPLDLRDNSGSANESVLRSYFGRLSYGFKGKYLVQVNARYDGSSRFHQDYRWGLFPSISAGWVASNEPFMEGLQAVSFLKLRASLGSLGNERIGNYPYQSTIAFSNALIYSGTTPTSFQTAFIPQYAVQDISWESTESWDIGLDANFLNNSLQVTVDYFKKTTRDMLLRLEIPRYVGLSNPNQNAGEMYTKGWEFGVLYGNSIGGLQYTVSANIFDSKSIMGDLKGTQFLGNKVKLEGSKFNEWYGYRTDGLFQTQEEVDNSVTLRASTKPGDIKYLDIGGPGGVPDGFINEDDLTLLGGSLPRYQYGGNISLAYKNFDLSIIFQGVGKVNSYKPLHMVIPDHYGVPDFVYGNTWSSYNNAEKNKQAPYPIGGEAGRSHNYKTSDYWLFNGSYFRLKNVIMGYSIPSQIIEKTGMKDLRVYVNLSDLFSIDNRLPGWDPEQDPFSRGYFITKAYILSISAKF